MNVPSHNGKMNTNYLKVFESYVISFDKWKSNIYSKSNNYHAFKHEN